MIFVIGTAVFLEAAILYTVNNKNVYQISKVLLDQAVDIIDKNQKNEDDMKRRDFKVLFRIMDNAFKVNKN